MRVNVIDVSKHNGVIDFNQVKEAGYEGVLIRAGYGKDAKKQKDPYFEINYKSAKIAGLHVGAYWYSYTETVKGARDEAMACASVLAGKNFDLPIYFDVEEKRQIEQGSEFLGGIITEFCSYLERLNYFVGIYMSAAYLKAVPMRVLVKYQVWVAQWHKEGQAEKLTYNLTRPGMWQYYNKGLVPGIAGHVDLDYMLIDFPTIIRNGGFNGYSNTYDLDVMEAAIKNEKDLEILYECKRSLEILRDRYL